MNRDFDVIVIGAGMAGASIAASLSETARVALVERENMPGYHTTGRSVAVYSAIYGNRIVRAVTEASRSFFESPPAGFAEVPLVEPRGALHIASEKSLAALDAFAAEPDVAASVDRVTGEEARAFCPILKREHAVRAVYERGAADMDVHAMHTGFLRRLRARGGTLQTSADLRELNFAKDRWHAQLGDTGLSAPVVVNAAGAWADEVARLAHVAPVGLEPRRRTIVVVDAPSGLDAERWPLVVDIDETFYFKPDAGRLLLSPGDETPSPPCDAQPDEMDVATAIDRVQRATTLEVKQVRGKWAGLRSFVADRSPVVGFDAEAPGFFWFAGQGGYGIQMAPALARLGAALVQRRPFPADIADRGVSAGDLAPNRLR